MRVAALIPAYRAAATVGAVVEETRAIVPAVLVVDDGSGDTTGAVARAAGAEVLVQPENHGKGAALAAGMRELVDRGVTHVLTLDADGQHLPAEIPRLLATAAANPQAIVVGVRKKAGFAIKPSALIGNWVADQVTALLAGQPLPDTQSGFRVYPVPATLDLGAGGTRYDFETEVLLRAARKGMPVVGVEVAVYYPPVEERVSHFDPWTDTARIVLTVLRLLVIG